MRTKVCELSQMVGQRVKMYLTLDVLRDQKNLQFLLAHDSSGSIQLVISKKSVSNHHDIGQLLTGSTFVVEGLIVTSSQSKTYGLEMQVESLTVQSKAQAWPIEEDSAIDLRFNYRVVDLKFKKNQLMLKLRSAFIGACSEFLASKEYIQISTPKLMAGASESGSEVFSVNYFDTKAFLSQSPQFYKEAAIASGLEGVYEVGPVFRAENSSSSRHLTEFTGLDVEVAWIFEISQIMEVEEQMLTYALGKLVPFKDQVKELFGVELITKPLVKYLSLDEAKTILAEHKVMSLGVDQDLPDEGERMLYEILGAHLIFVTDFPIAKRPFYHKWDRVSGTTKSFDLIFKGIEITSGAVREHDYETICQQVLDKGVSLESVSGYLDNFKYGCAPHAGFGLGVERVISRLLGISVKECCMFARDPQRLTP